MSEVFVISTQFMENYGAHTGKGDFKSGGHYWKFKGGEDYVVTGFDREQDAAAFIAEHYCSMDDDGIKEFPTKWRTYDEWLDEIHDFSDDYKQFIMESATKVEYPECLS